MKNAMPCGQASLRDRSLRSRKIAFLGALGVLSEAGDKYVKRRAGKKVSFSVTQVAQAVCSGYLGCRLKSVSLCLV